MEVTGIVKDGRIVLPSTVHLEEGAHVRVIFDRDSEHEGPYEAEPVSEEAVLADLAWATGTHFQP